MSIRLPQNSKEYLVVEFTDLLKTIVDLSSYTIEYKITEEDNSLMTGYDFGDEVPDIVDMVVKNLVDTSSGGPAGQFPLGNYKLYVKINMPPEVPIFGPFIWSVI